MPDFMNIAENKVALFNYQILESWEAGIKLTGSEVKAVKKGLINLKGSFISIKTNRRGRNEVWLKDAHIARYAKAGYAQSNYDPLQERKLLLSGKELKYLVGAVKRPGLTILPLSVYTSKRLIKIKVGLAKGKGQLDKRQAIKKRDVERQIQRSINR